MKIVCIIPARLNSKRFPEKVLSHLGEKPLLQWVWEAALSCPQFDQVVFAIDHPKTAALIKRFQGKYFMTKQTCPSGTDRLVELMDTEQIKGDIWVNWQGDEPFINPSMITDLLQTTKDLETDIWTLKKKITDQTEIINPHTVKVVTDNRGHALYFSRAPIPYKREQTPTYYKHIGLYAYRLNALKKIQKMAPSSLEKIELLEQLRFIEQGLKIKVHETAIETKGIDIPEDLSIALQTLSSQPCPSSF